MTEPHPGHGDDLTASLIRLTRRQPSDTDDYNTCIRARSRIAELEALLRRIDAVITWETTPLGRQFQEELEAALRR